MKCNEIMQAAVLAYANGGMGPVGSILVEQHLNRCPICRETVAEFQMDEVIDIAKPFMAWHVAVAS
jgi:anti-sigma factor ChrR (cupin superfamily)